MKRTSHQVHRPLRTVLLRALRVATGVKLANRIEQKTTPRSERLNGPRVFGPHRVGLRTMERTGASGLGASFLPRA